MNDKEKTVAEDLLAAIDTTDSPEKILQAVTAYREFLNAVSVRVHTEKIK